MIFITADGTIRYSLTGDTIDIPPISEVNALAISDKPIGLLANIIGIGICNWNGTAFRLLLGEDDLPDNHPDQLGITIKESIEYGTVVQLFIPTLGTEIIFDAPRVYGNWKNPRLSLAVNFSNIDNIEFQKTIYFLKSTSIPTVIDENQNYILPWTGDAYNVNPDYVNMLEIIYTKESAPQNKLLSIKNTAKDISSLLIDSTLGLYYEFEEADGFYNDFIDSSGYGNDGFQIDGSDNTGGTILTQGRGPGVNGNAFIANGTGAGLTTLDAVQIPHSESIALASNFTLAFWINLADLSNTNGLYCKDITTVGSSGFLMMCLSTGILETRINYSTSNSETGGRLYSTTALLVNTWYHVVYTFEQGVGSKLYINGTLDSSLTSTIILVTGTDPAFIGTNSVPNNNFRGIRTGGKMDVLKYWKRLLTPVEVASEYNLYTP